MIKIYHNPRCRKSREALQYLEKTGHPIEVVLYLKHPLTTSKLQKLIEQLNIRPEALIRTEEALWKTQYRGKELSDEALIDLMIKEPRLMQRPIVVYKDKAIIARPADILDNFIEL